MAKTPPLLSHVFDSLSDPIKELTTTAKNLHRRHFSSESSSWITVAPGRVNLIGEHTDYTGGFVLPLAIDYSTVVYGSGCLKGGSKESIICFVSATAPEIVEKYTLDASSNPPSANAPNLRSWIWYILGVVAQYLPDLPENTAFDISLAICGNVPLGSGLSSSASLEVSVARFLECILGEHAFSSTSVQLPSKARALRCQKAENEWCHSPCGIMDQYVSSAASDGDLLLIDCTSYEFEKVHTTNSPSLVIANSNVKHSIGGGEYPVRVQQCKEATAFLQSNGKDINTLRDATIDDVEQLKGTMDSTVYKRAKHVVSENARTLQARDALEASDWKRVGELMNGSHESMRDDYEVCSVCPQKFCAYCRANNILADTLSIHYLDCNVGKLRRN
jgi:galactokinase